MREDYTEKSEESRVFCEILSKATSHSIFKMGHHILFIWELQRSDQKVNQSQDSQHPTIHILKTTYIL